MHKYSDKEIKFLKEIIPGHSYVEISDLFYERFGIRMSISQIKGFVGNRKLNTGRTGRFEKGLTPWNKGLKGISIGGEATQFKKGRLPWNYMPVGTERINGDGYVDIKIEDPNRWKGKHILTWEQANGPLPKGHVVIFGDGNNRNFDLNNLILVSRAQLVRMNQKGLIKDDAELTKTGVIIADIYNKIGERKRCGK